MIKKSLIVCAVWILFSCVGWADEVQTRPVVVVSEDEALSPQQKAFLEEVREEKQLLRRQKNVPDKEQAARQAMEERQRQLKEERAAIKNDLEDGLAQLYNRGVRLYREKNFDEARRVFMQVDRLSFRYKKTQSYLKRLERRQGSSPKIAKTFQPVVVEAAPLSPLELEETYIYAVSLYNHEKFAEAKELFHKVAGQRPGYKLAERYLALIDKNKMPQVTVIKKRQSQKTKDASTGNSWQNFSGRTPAKAEPAAVPAPDEDGPEYEHAKALYAQAMRYYLEQDYEHARLKFMAVERVSPGYKNTREYLHRLENFDREN